MGLETCRLCCSTLSHPSQIVTCNHFAVTLVGGMAISLPNRPKCRGYRSITVGQPYLVVVPYPPSPLLAIIIIVPSRDVVEVGDWVI